MNTNSVKGFAVIAVMSLIAWYIAGLDAVKALSFSSLIVGILLGMVYANTLRTKQPKEWDSGIKFCSKRMLRLGIILYGFRFTFQDVIAVGKERRRNTRAAIAGLNMFCPSPPKVIFTTPIAKIAPIVSTHQGQDTGTFRARRIAVTTAERSPTEQGFLRRNLLMRYSTPTQETMLTPSRNSSFQP